jgi:hypothetical protein
VDLKPIVKAVHFVLKIPYLDETCTLQNLVSCLCHSSHGRECGMHLMHLNFKVGNVVSHLMLLNCEVENVVLHLPPLQNKFKPIEIVAFP